eukprot:9005831-Pyramimonas_sp.AAC.1
MVIGQGKDGSWPEFDMMRRRQGRKAYHAAGFPFTGAIVCAEAKGGQRTSCTQSSLNMARRRWGWINSKNVNIIGG